MKRLFLLSSAMIFSATMVVAAITADDVVATYQTKGYTTISVATGLTQIKVEAVLGHRKLEAIYDIATGAILRQETSRAEKADAGQGVSLTTVTHDFGGTKEAEGDHPEGDGQAGEDHAGGDQPGDGNSGPGGGQTGGGDDKNGHEAEKPDHGDTGDHAGSGGEGGSGDHGGSGGDHEGGSGGHG